MRLHRASLSIKEHLSISYSYVDVENFVLSSAGSLRKRAQAVFQDPVRELADLPLGTIIFSGVVVMLFSMAIGAAISWYTFQGTDEEDDYLDVKIERKRAETDATLSSSAPLERVSPKSALAKQRMWAGDPGTPMS